MTSFNDWMFMYPPSHSVTYVNKSKYLQKLDLLLHVFDREVSEIKKQLQNEYESVELSLANQAKAKPKGNDNKEETSTKPNLRLKKTPKGIETKSAKDSPDMFTQNIKEDQQIVISDSETVIFSPEAFSPKLKKKRHLRLNKSRELAKNSKPTTTPKGADNMDLDDIIECTPEIKSVKHATRSSTKKKLFERPAPKNSQSLFTLPEHFKGESKKNKSTSAATTAMSTQATQEVDYISGILKESNSNKCDNIPEVKEMRKGKKITVSQVFSEVRPVELKDDTTLLCTQNSLMGIDEILKRVSNDAQIDQEAEDPTVEVVKEQKKSCRLCDMKGSPCRKHQVRQELKEPDQTFSGFWDMDFTMGAKKSRIEDANLADDSSNNSTIYI